MKKDIAKQLSDLANSLPVVFEWEMMPEEFTGEELNLTPFGDHQKFNKEEKYEVYMPTLVANFHKQQFKDAYKKGGLPAVEKYRNDILDKINKGEVGVAKLENGRVKVITINSK